MPDWLVTAAMVCLIGVAAVIQAHTGFGFALFLTPFSAMLIGPKETVLLAAVLALATNGLQAFRLRHSVRRRTASLLAAGSFLGMPVGITALILADPAWLKAGTAVAVLTATVLVARGAQIPAMGVQSDVLAGLVSGVLNTSTGISGPPIAIYLHGRLMAPSEFRGTIAAFFLFTAAGAITLVALAASIETRVLTIAGLSLPFLFAGNTVGNSLFHRTDDAFFRRAVLAVLFSSGAAALVGALLEVW